MKEATSELTLTIIIVALVAGLVAFFYGDFWDKIKTQQDSQVYCKQAICGKKPNSDGKVDCTYTDKNGNEKNITCNYKG